MKTIWKGEWEDEKTLIGDFAIKTKDLQEVEILAADYEADGYEGSALVIFQKDEKLFLVSGSHCSCYGLENQWEPDEISWEYLKNQSKNEWYSHRSLIHELLEQRELA